MSKFTDLYVERDEDGVYDLVIEDGDFKKTAGMDSAVIVSLGSDRRANPDEVADPMKRRGWCGTEHTPDQQGNAGCGIWLYEQRRLTRGVSEGVRMEAYQGLNWMVFDGLAKNITVNVETTPAERLLSLNASITAANGGITNVGFQLWDNTPRRTIKK